MRVGVYFFPLGRWFLVRKVFSVLVCFVDFQWLVCPVVVVLNFIFYWYLFLFSLLVSRYPFFFCFWSFRELSNFEICFASFVLILKKSSFFLFHVVKIFRRNFAILYNFLVVHPGNLI